MGIFNSSNVLALILDFSSWMNPVGLNSPFFGILSSTKLLKALSLKRLTIFSGEFPPAYRAATTAPALVPAIISGIILDSV